MQSNSAPPPGWSPVPSAPAARNGIPDLPPRHIRHHLPPVLRKRHDLHPVLPIQIRKTRQLPRTRRRRARSPGPPGSNLATARRRRHRSIPLVPLQVPYVRPIRQPAQLRRNLVELLNTVVQEIVSLTCCQVAAAGNFAMSSASILAMPLRMPRAHRTLPRPSAPCIPFHRLRHRPHLSTTACNSATYRFCSPPPAPLLPQPRPQPPQIPAHARQPHASTSNRLSRPPPGSSPHAIGPPNPLCPRSLPGPITPIDPL